VLFSSPTQLNPLRIALLTYSTKPRGSVVHTLELAEALHRLGHTVCVYALDKDGEGFDRPLACDFKLIPAKLAPSDMDGLIQQRIREFVDFLESDRLTYDCYHAQDCIGANALAILRERGHIAHVVRTVHHIEDYTSPYLQQCQDRSIRNPDLCLCVSTQWQTELLHRYHIAAPRVINGINSQRFSPIPDGSEPALKQQLGLIGTPIYLTVGGIEPRKNSIRLLEAFAEILADYPSAQFAIAGGATVFDYQEYRNEFFALADRLGVPIGESLILPGVISDADLPVLYRTADAFVFPSVKEGWGLVLLEAIASGLPVITSRQAPFTEFLADSQALLVDPLSSAAIAQAMRSILDPTLAQSLIQNSQPILSQYTWATSAQMHLNHYYNLIAQPKRN
jgi:glycosyltransferase-like protein